MLLGISEGTSIHTNLRLTEGNIHVEIALRTRAITDKRLRRGLIGLTAVAVTVGLATIVIHDRIH